MDDETMRELRTYANMAGLSAEFAELLADAERYRKLRGWMSSNVPEGWLEIEQLAAIACWVDWDSFNASLDALPECKVGLMNKAVGAA